MEILYFSSVPSPNEFNRIKKTIRPDVNITTYGMNESGYKFHTLLMNGLSQHKHVNIKSLVGRSVSHQTHLGLYWKKRREKVSPNLEYIHLGFFNLPIIKHLSIGLFSFIYTLSWQIKNRKKEKGVILDAAYITANPFVIAACKLFCCSKTAIFCDIYDYMANVQDAQKNNTDRITLKLARKISNFTYKNLDSFIFLTEEMNSIINLYKKPHLVIEGIADINMQSFPKSDLPSHNFDSKEIIMYAGALREAYGLKNLAEGFIAYQNNNAELWIFGDGDFKKQLYDYTQQDKRIHFGGVIPLSEVIEKEIQATILINPRPVDQEFNKYSFPSKIMEYMSSGTPVLTTKLPGIPKEYYNYLYTINGDTSADITQALETVISVSKIERFEKGNLARTFVLQYKNNIHQTSLILDLLKKTLRTQKR